MKNLLFRPQETTTPFTRTTFVDATLQIAVREVGLALGASRVSANIGTSRQSDGEETSGN
jgi:hypothetical protein